MTNTRILHTFKKISVTVELISNCLGLYTDYTYHPTRIYIFIILIAQNIIISSCK